MSKQQEKSKFHIFHKWSKWEQIEHGKEYYGKSIVQEILQTRVCLICDKKEIETIWMA